MNHPRRLWHRHSLRPLTYVSLGADNGGILTDLSEGGMGIRAVKALQPGSAIKVRFQLPDTRHSIETDVAVAWADSTGQVGLRFSRLTLASRQRLMDWILNEYLSQANLSEPEVEDAPASQGVTARATMAAAMAPAVVQEVKWLRRDHPFPESVPVPRFGVDPQISIQAKEVSAARVSMESEEEALTRPSFELRLLSGLADAVIVMAALGLFTAIFGATMNIPLTWNSALVLVAAATVMIWAGYRLCFLGRRAPGERAARWGYERLNGRLEDGADSRWV